MSKLNKIIDDTAQLIGELIVVSVISFFVYATYTKHPDLPLFSSVYVQEVN